MHFIILPVVTIRTWIGFPHAAQVVAWLWSPMIFNPNGVEWLDVIKDFDGWLQWMTAEDDDPDKSWHAWWIQQNAVIADDIAVVMVYPHVAVESRWQHQCLHCYASKWPSFCCRE